MWMFLFWYSIVLSLQIKPLFILEEDIWLGEHKNHFGQSSKLGVS